MAIKYFAGNRITGLSTDTKPTNVEGGTVFEETDTNKIYRFVVPNVIAPTWDGSNDGWVQSGNAFVLDTTTDNRIETISTTSDTGSDAVYYDLGSGTQVEDADWVLQFSARATGSPSSSTPITFALASQVAFGSNFGGTGDALALVGTLRNGGSKMDFKLTKSVGGTISDVAFGGGGYTQYNSQWWGTLDYTQSTGVLRFRSYTNSSRTTLLETITATVASNTINGLRYIMFGSGYWSSAKYMNADNYIRDVSFYAGSTTIPSGGSYTLQEPAVSDGAITVAKLSTVAKKETIGIACSDETTALTTGTAKTTFRMPYAFTLTDVKAVLTTAGTTSGTTTVDINEDGSSILSTVLTIDYDEKTSTTASTPAVISDTSLANDAEITIDIDAVTGGATETGLKVYLIGYKTE